MPNTDLTGSTFAVGVEGARLLCLLGFVIA
jgi:hypothetical protein